VLDILKNLNPEQKKAVTHGEGPLLVVAGAGTGKTQVITIRIAYLIATKKAKPEEILALTFTDKAATEMEERVDILVPYGYTDFWISTFHSFGDRVLKENALELGFSPDFQVLTPPEQIILFRENLFKFPLSYYRPLGNPTRYIEAILALISRAKDEDITPEEYINYAQKLNQRAKDNPEDTELAEISTRELEVAQTYQSYQELLAQKGKVDFGDLITLTLKLFRNHPAILKHYQRRFRYILVDEFQDTNYSQFQLVKLLAKDHQNITVVGDDDQCLPPGTLIKTKNGEKKIENISVGEEVITAVGKGYTGYSRVSRIFKNKKYTRFLTFQTEKGLQITVTDNHKMFCFIPPVPSDKNLYYVYLIWRKGLGWRLGTTNDLAGRLRLERSADKILGLRCFLKEKEAKYFETLWSLKYGIPTVCFKSRDGLFIADEWLKKLYEQLNTERGVEALAKDLRVDISSHHFCLDGFNRGDKSRIKINLEVCHRKYTAKSKRSKPLNNPSVLHQVSLQTSNDKVIKKLREANIPLTKAKKGIRVRIASASLEKVGAIAEHLKKITGGIIESKFSLGTLNVQHKPALIIPASNVLVGFYLPILEGSKVIYDKVVKVSEEIKAETVYDLEIGKTHNFIASGVVVHNSIYKFRGAAISNILGFLDTYPKATQIVLTKNYRSPQSILDSAYRLISYNNPDRLEFKNNIDKHLIAEKKEEGIIKHFHCDSLLSEAERVANLIKERRKEKGYSWSDFAILVRANNDADPFLRALNMQDIPWRFSGNEGLYDREEIRFLISFLRVIANPEDSVSLYYLASSDIYELPAKDLTLCMNYATRQNRSLFHILSHISEISPLEEEICLESKATIDKLLKDIESYIKLSTKAPTGEILYNFITKSGYLKSLTSSPSLSNEEKVRNIAKFFDLVQSSSHVITHNRVAQFVSYLDLLIQAGDNPGVAEAEMDTDAVNVLTIHKAKGLEFPVVIMVSLVKRKFPSDYHKEPIPLPEDLIKDILPSGDFHLQEERRLFYVGMTRAKRELYLTSAKDYGGKRERRVSRFVLEALNLSSKKVSSRKTPALEIIERSAPKEKGREGTYLKIPDDEILTLSYFQVDDYLTCPLKYKYIHVLRVPILQHHAVIYGKALHDAVQNYYKVRLSGKQVKIDDIIKVFENSWINEGFMSKEHEQERLEEGRETLRSFYQRAEEERFLPTYVEKEFNFMLGKNRIVGRWDRVDIIDGDAYIIDFKSSRIEDKKRADKRTKESLQLCIYALAYQKIFGKLPKKVKLYFLGTGVVGEAELKEKDLDKTIGKIQQASVGIRSRSYKAKPEYMSCRWCAYQKICPYKGEKNVFLQGK